MLIEIVGDLHDSSLITTPGVTTIQLGDFGIEASMILEAQINKDLYVIAGNHDLFELFKTPNWVHGWGSFDWPVSNFYLSGAYSQDKMYRIARGWPYSDSEEHSYEDLMKAYDDYCKVKPKIMLSHCAPDTLLRATLSMEPYNTKTTTILEAMFEDHKPSLWVFGHYHKSGVSMVGECKSVALGIRERLLINLEDFE